MQRAKHAVALRQAEGAMGNACSQVASGSAGTAIGFQIIQHASLLFTQAHGFGQPKGIEGGQCSHTVSLD